MPSVSAEVHATDRASLAAAIDRLLERLDYTGSTRARLSRGHDQIGWVAVEDGRVTGIERM